jgi:crossover junction endodeoxyribonuclease RuvC
MQEMVRVILNLRTQPKPDDAADALAIALCHAQSAPFLARTGQG